MTDHGNGGDGVPRGNGDQVASGHADSRWWVVSDRAGREVAQVPGAGYRQAQAAAQEIAEVREAVRRDGGLYLRRTTPAEDAKRTAAGTEDTGAAGDAEDGADEGAELYYALLEMFGQEVAEQVELSAAYGALTQRVRQITNDGYSLGVDRDEPMSVWAALSDDTLRFVPEADDPAAFLAARLRALLEEGSDLVERA